MLKTGWFVQCERNTLDEYNRAMCDLQKDALIKEKLLFDHVTPVEANARLAKIFAGETEPPDWVLYRAPDPGVRKTFDLLDVPCVNPYRTTFLCRDKMLNAALCQKLSLSHPLTYRVPALSNIEKQQDDIIGDIEEMFSYPLVVKSSSGSGGEGVFLVQNREELLETIPVNSPDVIIQEFIASSYGKDARVFVVDGEVIFAHTRYNEGSFKSNVSGGGTRNVYTPTKEEVAIARKIGHELPLSSISVDFMWGSDGEPIVCELNSNPNFGRGGDDAFDGSIIADAIASMLHKIADNR